MRKFQLEEKEWNLIIKLYHVYFTYISNDEIWLVLINNC